MNANPAQNKKKGADGGVDGIKFFRDLDNGAHKIVVSGKLKADDVRALNHVARTGGGGDRAAHLAGRAEQGDAGGWASSGLYTSVNGKLKVPRVQLLTVAGLLASTQRAEHPDYEQDLNFKKAKAEASHEQQSLI